MQDLMLEMLECAACHGTLAWEISQRSRFHIEEGAARCVACGTVYPIREGIGIFLTPDLPRDDLWEQVDSQLTRHLGQHPEIERQLMQVPVDSLAPADQFFRALVLEQRGDYAQAKAITDLVRPKLYSSEYLACFSTQVDWLLERLVTQEGAIVDLASGRCELVEAMARRLERPIIATDFSPTVLRRDRQWLEFLGLYDRVSLLAFDARRTPFKDGVIKTLTTNLGLPNIGDSGNLLRELRRIVIGTLWAISIFYPEHDEINQAAIHQLQLSTLLFRRTAFEAFAATGWQIEAASTCMGKALPTPIGVVIDGAGIDTLPVTETIVEWCVLVAH